MSNCVHDNNLVFVFENSDEARFCWCHVQDFMLTNVAKDILMFDNKLVHIPTFASAEISILPDGNREHIAFDQFESGISVFDRIINGRDISQIVVESCDGETEYMISDEQDISCYRDGENLIIKIG